MKRFEVGDVIRRSGSVFKVLGRTDTRMLSEQTIGGKVVAYEVVSVRQEAESIHRDGKWVATGEIKESYPYLL